MVLRVPSEPEHVERGVERSRDLGRHVALLGLWWLSLIAIVTGSLLPSNSLAMSDFDLLMMDLHIPDKWQHFGAYVWLAWLATVSFRGRRRVLAVISGLLLLGLAIEWLQTQIPGRTFEWRDLLANATGLVTGGISGLVMHRARFRPD
jgi:hypothetical protein